MKQKLLQKGNVLFIILIAVALFAALSYAVSSTMRGGTSTISSEQARVAAGEILRSMQDIKQGYQYLWTQQGCSIDEISFIMTGKSIGAEDFDALSPKADDSCDIFSTQGAGISYPNIRKYQVANIDAVNPLLNNILYFSFSGSDGGRTVVNLGSSSPEYIVFVTNLEREICVNINKHLGYNNYNNDFYEPVGTMVIGEEYSDFSGKNAGCLIRSAGDTFGYQLFYVLQDF